MRSRSAASVFMTVGSLLAWLLWRGLPDAGEDARPSFLSRRAGQAGRQAGRMTPGEVAEEFGELAVAERKNGGLASRCGRSADHPGKGRRAQVLGGLGAAAAHQQDADSGRSHRGDHSS